MPKKVENKGPSFRNSIFWGVVSAIAVLFILYYMLEVEGLMRYSLWIVLICAILMLLATLLVSLFSGKIFRDIMTEDNDKILNLKLNQSLSISIFLIGFSIAFIIPALTVQPFDSTLALILIIGLFFLFLGTVIFVVGYLPRLDKLLIRARLEEEGVR